MKSVSPLMLRLAAMMGVSSAILTGCSLFSGDMNNLYQHRDDAAALTGTEELEPSKYGNPKYYVVNGRSYRLVDSNAGFTQSGIASWYGPDFHGKRTSSGETYDMHAMTAAHKTLIIPCYVEVTNLENGRKAIVKVNDRGPFHEGRIIDLSYAAAKKLGVDTKGTAKVKIRVVGAGSRATASVNKPREDDRKWQQELVYMQVGAFSQRENAERLRERLITARVHGTQIISKDNIYQVRVGPLESVEHTDQLIETLHSLNITHHHIVVE